MAMVGGHVGVSLPRNPCNVLSSIVLDGSPSIETASKRRVFRPWHTWKDLGIALDK